MIKNLLLILSFCAGIIGYSQEAPKAVNTAFSKKFPHAFVLTWEKLENASWQVYYTLKKEKYRSVFAEGGDWMETQYEISIDDLPEKIKATLKRDFSDFDVSTVAIILSKTLTSYLIVIGDGGVDLEILMNENGEIIKQSSDSEEEEMELQEEEIEDTYKS